MIPNIKKAIKDAGHTQGSVAKALGKHQPNINVWANNPQNLTITQLNRIAKAIDQDFFCAFIPKDEPTQTTK